MQQGPSPIARQSFQSLLPIGRTLAWGVVACAALLTFPAHVALACLLGAVLIAVLVFLDRPVWLPAVIIMAMLLVKGLYWTRPMVGFAIGLAAVLVMELARAIKNRRATPPPPESRFQRRVPHAIALLLLMLAGLVLVADGQATTPRNPRKLDSRPLACFGDSLTSGIPPDPGYPTELAKLLKVPVLSHGYAGHSTQQAMSKLPQLLGHKPQLVIVELGGHDFLTGKDRAATKTHLVRIISILQANGAEVVLFEVPRGFIRDSYHGLERELADEFDLLLIPDSANRQLVLWSPSCPPGLWTGGPYLSRDGLHANAAGARYQAEQVALVLARVYGQEILSDQVEKTATPDK